MNREMTGIVRDSAFVRLYADEVSVMTLGRDLELAFLAVSPLVTKRMERSVGDDREVGYEFSPSMAEVARIRLSPASGLQTSMALLQYLIRGDMVKLDDLEEAVLEMIKEARAADRDEGAE